MWFFLGVGFMVAGVAFCVLRTIKLPGGRVLRAVHAQICGVVLLCYFPLVFLVRRFTLEWEYVFSQMLYGGLAVLCLLIVLIVILRTTTPARPARQYGSPATPRGDLFAEDSPPVEAVQEGKPATARRGKKQNPFDFS